jgi:hypothetical protein
MAATIIKGVSQHTIINSKKLNLDVERLLDLLATLDLLLALLDLLWAVSGKPVDITYG